MKAGSRRSPRPIATSARSARGRWRSPTASTSATRSGPRSWHQFVDCLRGMGDACRALDFPIVSGNVSLYNESKATGGGSAILPTPAIGGVGILDDWRKTRDDWVQRPRAEADRSLIGLAHWWTPRPVAVAARSARPQGRVASAGRSRLRDSGDRRVRARALIADGHGDRRPRRLRRRLAGRDRRDGAGRRHGR